MTGDGSAGAAVVAVDGPAGAGKSTVAREVARRLGFLHLDTGAMYRAVTLAALRSGTDLADGVGLGEVARSARIEIESSADGRDRVLLDGEDVTEAVRSAEVTAAVSTVAAVRPVREALVAAQRRLARDGSGAVLEGRDIGSVVFPDARWKFYLDASADERARRRASEIAEFGRPADADAIRREIDRRDAADSNRPVNPLVRLPDAVYLDSTGLTVEQVVEEIVRRVRGG